MTAIVTASTAQFDWVTPAERKPTFEDGPRRFRNKVEVEVECADGVERRNFFVGSAGDGFDDNDWLRKRVIRWRPVPLN
jgi:hypothetical protein